MAFEENDTSDSDLLNFLNSVDKQLELAKMTPTETVTTNTITTVTNNMTSNPSNFVPKMIFPNSVVTINYNFGKPN